MAEETKLKKFIPKNLFEDIDFEYLHKRHYYGLMDDENDLGYWYPEIVPLVQCFTIPETFYYFLDYDEYSLFTKTETDSELEKNQVFYKTAYNLIDKAKERDFELYDRDLFLKSGGFSDKFNFNDAPYIKKGTAVGEILHRFFRILYDSSCVGCPLSTRIVLREFLTTDYDRPSIYNGMKLNTEIRAFYDFDTKELLGLVNYWDYNTMINGLFNEDDLKTFKEVGKEIEEDYKRVSPQLEKLLKESLQNIEIELKGRWSIDFMYLGDNREKPFCLIDMATAETSAYYNLVAK